MNEAQMEERIQKQMNTCVHFNGIQNRRCEADVDYSEKAGGKGALLKLPCLLHWRDPEGAVDCEHARHLTREEAIARIEEIDRDLQEWIQTVAAGICPNCRVNGRWSQVGRCVYCGECGHRIYQGRLPESKR